MFTNLPTTKRNYPRGSIVTHKNPVDRNRVVDPNYVALGALGVMPIPRHDTEQRDVVKMLRDLSNEIDFFGSILR